MKKTMAKMLNVFSGLLLAAAILASTVMFVAKPIQAWSGTIASSFYSGSGTETSPYVIRTVAQFGYFVNSLNNGVTYEGKYIQLGTSLNLTGESWTYASTAQFNGSLDGQCYTITSNCTILPDIGASGVVQKINAVSNAMENSSLLCQDNRGTIRLCTARGDMARGVCSALICQENYGMVQYCGAVGSAQGSSSSGDSYAAMVAMNKGTVDSCFSAMTVSASASGKYNDGNSHPLTNGQWGYSTTAPNCYYDMTLYTRTTTVGTGLTTEEMKSAEFLQMISGYTLPGTKWVTGSDGYPTLQSCSTSTVSFTGFDNQVKAAYHTSNQKVTLVRSGSGTIYYTTDGTDPTTSSTRKSSTSSSVSAVLSGDMTLSAVVYYSGSYGTITKTEFIYMPGSGTQSSPYQILSKKGLDAVRLDTDAYYQLKTNLTYTSDDYEFGGVAAGGWLPIPSFEGTFDGCGYAITGLEGTRGGFVSYNSGTISNLRMVDHKLLTDDRSGPIANENTGLITRCYAKSAFTSSNFPRSVKPTFYVHSGGIAGYSSGQITYCMVEGVVVGRGVTREGDQYIGGIAGYGCAVDNCVSYAQIVSVSDYETMNNIHAGGIVGSGNAENCRSNVSFYVDARINYDAYIGGISGHFYTSYAFNCVADSLSVTQAPNAYIRLYKRAFAYNGNFNYSALSNSTPSDYPELDFEEEWMPTNKGAVPQGVMDANGHCYTLKSYSGPDCEHQGITVAVCSLCGKQTEFTTSGEQHQQVKDEAVAPTCTETGLTAGAHCELCGDILTAQQKVDVLGHSFTNYISNEDFTCTEDGTETAQCDRCDEIDKRTEEGSARHIFGDYVNDENVSCTADGTETARCENCDETDTRVLAGTMLPHSFTSYVSDGNATYTTDGTETAKCDHCDETDSRTEVGSRIEPVSISVITLPSKVSYLAGEQLDPAGLVFRAVYKNGDTMDFNAEQAESITADLETAGKKMATVTYMGLSAQFEVQVHEAAIIKLDPSTYPESDHSYSNYLNQTKTFTYPGATSLKITFNSSTYVESNFDYIYVYDKADKLLAKYTAHQAANVTLTITGDTFKVQLTSDRSNVYYGYGFSSIYADMGGFYHPPVTVPTTATCVTGGLSEGRVCEICDIVLTEQVATGALGHSFTNYTSDGNATGAADGTKTAVCDRCDATDTVTDVGSKLKPVSIRVLTPPDVVSCAVGQKPALDGLTLLASFDGAEDVILTADLVESYTAATDTAGVRNATVTYMGQSATFTVYVHALGSLEIDSSLYPESQHNYEAYSNDIQKFTWEGAESLKITFSSSTVVEQKFDHIYLLDGAQEVLYDYTGTAAAGATVTIPGDTFYVKLTSDYSVQKWGYSFSSIVAEGMLVHPALTIPAVEATCTTTGLTEGRCCEICGLVLAEQEEVGIKEHDFCDWYAITEATCTQQGEEGRICGVCSYSETRVQELAAHDWTDATCTAPKTCDTCGATEGEALGHNHEAVVTEPSCTEKGYTTHICACGDTYTDCETDALDHDYVQGICTRCGDEIAHVEAPVIKGTNDAESGKIKLSWDEVSGAAKYKVYCSTKKSSGYKRLTTTSSRSYIHKAGQAGSAYYYYVVAVAEDGRESDKSNIVNRSCDYARPVVSMTNDAASGKIKLTWDAVDGASDYRVYQSTSKNGTYTLLNTVADTTYIDASAEAGSRSYYYVIAAGSKAAADSAKSSVLSRLCDLARPVIQTSNVASTGKVKVSWEAVDGAVSYNVYRANSSDGEYTLMKNTTSTSYTNTGAKAGETYYYRVMAVHSDSNANSAKSTAKYRTCDLARPDVSIELKNGKPKLSWSEVDGAVCYEIYRSTSESDGYALAWTTTSTSYTNTSAKSGTTYYYKVIAVHSKSAANSVYSLVDSITAK